MGQNGFHPRVLLIDDEDMILISIRALLNLETDFDVSAFTDPADALSHLRDNKVDAIVTDYLMPNMTGLDLLRHARDAQPEASRILLTGHADKKSAIRAINEVGLYQYLEKPWDNEQLLLVIRGAIERTQLLRSLEAKVNELDSAHSQIKEAQRRLIRAFL